MMREALRKKWPLRTKGYHPLSKASGEFGRGRGIGPAAVVVDVAEVPRSVSAIVSRKPDVCLSTALATEDVESVGGSVGGVNTFASDAAPRTTTTMARNGKNSQGLRSLRTRLVSAD